MGRRAITSSELKGCLRGGWEAACVRLHIRVLGSVGPSGWSASLSVSESLLLDMEIEPLPSLANFKQKRSSVDFISEF